MPSLSMDFTGIAVEFFILANAGNNNCTNLFFLSRNNVRARGIHF